MILIFLAFQNWALLFLRLIVAMVLFTHGWPKIKNFKLNSENFRNMGFRPGWLWGSSAALFESAGALFLALGLGTQIIGLLLVIEMLVIVSWKRKKGKKLIGGYESDILLLGAGLILATMGGGQFAFLF